MAKIALDFDLSKMSIAGLGEYYNQIAGDYGRDKRNAKFPDRATAEKRVQGLITDVSSGGEAEVAPVTVAPAKPAKAVKPAKVTKPAKAGRMGPETVLRMTPSGEARKCRPDTETAAVWAQVRDGMTLAALDQATEGVDKKFPARAHVKFSVRHGFLTVE